LEAVKNAKKVRAVVVATTDKVYAGLKKQRACREDDALGGKDPYSVSKVAADMITQMYIQSWERESKGSILGAIVRAGNVIGGGDWSKDRLIPDLVRSRYSKGKLLVIRYPEAVRSWQFVLEPVRGYLQLAQGLYRGKKKLIGAWNFGPKKDGIVTVRELIKESASLITGKLRVKVRQEKSKPEEKYLSLSISKARKELGWTPKLKFKEALKLSLDWYEAYYKKQDMIAMTNQQIDEYFKL